MSLSVAATKTSPATVIAGAAVSRFLVINCENSLAWDPVDFGDMFMKRFGIEGDTWVKVNVAKGESLPSQDQIDSSFQGIVITGSHFNCRDRDTLGLTWFEPVCDIVRSASVKGFPRIYGGCFGCQISAFALGCDVDKNPSGRFILKAETMHPTKDFREFICECCVEGECFKCCGCCGSSLPCECGKGDNVSKVSSSDGSGGGGGGGGGSGSGSSNIVDSIPNPSTAEIIVDIDPSVLLSLGSEAYQIIVSHGDQVLNLPEGAYRLASSSSCENELFVCGKNRNILCNQSHPEFEYKYAVQERIWPAVVDKNQRLSEEEVEESRRTFAEFNGSSGPDRLNAFISRFLRHGTSS